MKKCLLFLMVTMLTINLSAQTTFTSEDEVLLFTVTGSNEVSVQLNLKDTEEVTDTFAVTQSVYNGQNFTVGSSYTMNFNDSQSGWTTPGGTTNYKPAYTITAKLGQINYGSTNYYAAGTHSPECSLAEEVVIPATVEYNGTTYNVTSIPNRGFEYQQAWGFLRPRCDGNYNLVNSRFSNRHLKKVTFENNSNIQKIGSYAFACCLYLESITIPSSVTIIGEGAFEACESMKKVEFQKRTDGTVGFSRIEQYTFYDCDDIVEFDVPEGVTYIGNQAFVYNFSLQTINLPQTLTTIGNHFVCNATSLTTLTIPASVISIDGACFHGCEALKSVYLLGPAAALEGSTSGQTDSFDTFDGNVYWCTDHVAHCSFYVLPEYLQGYKDNSVWSRIDDDGEWDDSHPNKGKYGNYLIAMEEITRKLQPKVWVSAIFPKGLTGYKSNESGKLGAEAKVAVMDIDEPATVDIYKNTYTSGTDEPEKIWLYKIKFKILEEDDIPAGVPVMIKPSMDTEVVFYDQDDEKSSDFKLDMTNSHSRAVEATDGAVITMNGKYIPYKLTTWDFYFLYKNKTTDSDGKVKYDEDENAKFYRVSKADNAPTVKECRCYWSIDRNGIKVNPTSVKANNDVFSDTATDVEDVSQKAMVVVDGIYDLQGRKLDIPAESLPRGVFVINGIKTVIK